MSKENARDESSPKVQAFYVMHNHVTPHLDFTDNREEAEILAKEYGTKVYTGAEVLAALGERHFLRAVANKASQLCLSSINGEALTSDDWMAGLRPLLMQGALNVIVLARAGLYDETYPKSFVDRVLDIGEEIGEEIEKLDPAEVNLNRRVKVVASHPAEGQTGIQSLIGQQFDILAYNAATDQVQIESPMGGKIIIGPDEYVFADEA